MDCTSALWVLALALRVVAVASRFNITSMVDLLKLLPSSALGFLPWFQG